LMLASRGGLLAHGIAQGFGNESGGSPEVGQGAAGRRQKRAELDEAWPHPAAEAWRNPLSCGDLTEEMFDTPGGAK
jgi:hypothetical protein